MTATIEQLYCKDCDVVFTKGSIKEQKHLEEFPKHNLEIEEPTLRKDYHKIKPQEKFKVTKKGKKFELELLTRPIQALRPITLLEDNTRMMLVYLPTKLTNNDDKNQESEFRNSAFFIANESGKKKIIPYDDPQLKENYNVTVLPDWYQTRWQLHDINSWLLETELVNPVNVYNLIEEDVRKYLDFTNESDYAYFVLWNICTYFYELFDSFPYNNYTGTKRAGKTKTMEYQENICYNAILTSDITGSAFFRIIEGIGPTLLIDESEQFKNRKNESAQHVRSLLMNGFLRNKFALRSEGKASEGFSPKTFNLFCPKSLAHINQFDDVLEDRCIKQLMRRSKDKGMLNVWPDSRNPVFKEIRNNCYRLFLDHAVEINELQKQASELLDVTGRELKLWTPIITLALFFQNHGKKELVQTIKNKTKESSADRQIKDEQDNRDLQILRFCDVEGVKMTEEHEHIKDNPAGWIPTQMFYDKLCENDNPKEYGINPEYFSRSMFSNTLERLGFKTEKKSGGISWLITRFEVNDVKESMGMLEPKQKKLDDEP